jgi:hypothetical protein
MKLWDLLVIGLIKMCTKFRQKKLSGSASLTSKLGLKGIQGKLGVFTLFKGKSRIFMGIMGYIMVYLD